MLADQEEHSSNAVLCLGAFTLDTRKVCSFCLCAVRQKRVDLKSDEPSSVIRNLTCKELVRELLVNHFASQNGFLVSLLANRRKVKLKVVRRLNEIMQFIKDSKL